MFLIPPVKAGAIPNEYSQDLSLNGTYIYNITQFDSHFTWWDIDWMNPSKGTAYTNPGGQIHVNITGFYNKSGADYSCIDNPIPHIGIKFLENQSNVLIANFSLNNISNSEVSMDLAIGYSSFLSGFIIPLNNLTRLKEQAYAQDTGGMAGIISIEETYNYIYFDFKQNTKAQNSTMIYDRHTGLLLWAKVENQYGPDLEIFLTNYSFAFENSYLYNVTEFDSHFTWWDIDWMSPSKGTAYTNPGGYIIVNFTGYYAKAGADYSCFDGPIPHLNITFYENQSILNLTVYNASNSEAAMDLTVGYSAFLSGFFMPVENITKLYEQAYAQDSGGMAADIQIKETNLTIKFTFFQDSKAQNSTMIYEKDTGLLLWSEVENQYGPDLEISIGVYTPWEEDEGGNNYTWDGTILGDPPFIPSFPIVLTLGISSFVILVLVRKTSKKRK